MPVNDVLQLIEDPVTFTVGPELFEIGTVSVTAHEPTGVTFASIICTVAIPALRLFAVCVVCPEGLHKKVYAPEPPVIGFNTDAVPVLNPHPVEVVEVVPEICVFCVTFPDMENVQPLASVAVTLTLPAASPVIC